MSEPRDRVDYVPSVNSPGAFGPAPDGPPLTQDEINALPDGTRLIIIWSGGNGPHEYTLVTDPSGQWRIAKSGTDRPDYFDIVRAIGPDEFIGPERFHTRVWLAPRASQEGER